MSVDYTTLRDSALSDLKNYMDSLDPDKGKKLAYWLKDYSRFLKQEATFQPDKLNRYKRGAIVKVHLGYRIGSEEGGLHYAIVMDRNNSICSPTITVIPLTSIKEGTDISRLPPSKVPIGSEVHSLLTANFNAEIRSAKRQVSDVQSSIDKLFEDPEKAAEDAKLVSVLNAQLSAITKQLDYCEKMKNEAQRMKIGSIALVGQITTVSKIRIYDPKYSKDALSKVRVSSTTLDMLDLRVQELFGNPVKPQSSSLQDQSTEK